MEDKYAYLSMIIIGAVVFGGIGYLILSYESDKALHDSFCRDNGYDKVVRNSNAKHLEGMTYVQCLDEEVADRKLVEHRDWLLYEGDS